MPAGITVLREIPDDDTFDTAILALKPQQVAGLRTTPLAAMAPRVLVSVLAGVDCATLAGVSRACS